MSMSARRGWLMAAANAAGGRTYADFEAHITNLGGVQKTVADTLVASIGSSANIVLCNALNQNSMSGSSWGNVGFGAPYEYGPLPRFGGAILHGMPSSSEFSMQVSNNAKVRAVMAHFGASVEFLNSVTRNGYASSVFSSESGTPVFICTEILYWDFSQNKSFRMTPNTSGGPFPYDW